MTLFHTKTALRIAMRAHRRNLRHKEVALLSQKVQRRVLQLPAVQQAQRIFVYVAVGKEVQTRALIEAFLAQGTIVYVPKISKDGSTMHPVRLWSCQNLRRGMYGIPAPASSTHYTGPIDLAIVPGLAFSSTGARLGQGKGFYDRFFAIYSIPLRIGLAYPWQVVQTVPEGPHDVPLHHVVTPFSLY